MPTTKAPPGWTIETLRLHHEAQRAADEKFEQERDRRYTEVALEREKALKIKETADLAALSLAREIQTYKDEKANQLREQISSERGLYATKDDLASVVKELTAAMKPALDLISSQSGARGAFADGRAVLASVTGLVVAVVVVAAFVIARASGG